MITLILVNTRLHDTLQLALFQGRTRISGEKRFNDVDSINIHTGYFGNTLQAAAFGGYAMIITIILERGAGSNF